MRPSPIHLREALKARVRRNEIIQQPKAPNPPGLSLPDFYTLPDFSLDNPADAARRAEVLALYETFFRAGQEDHGRALERAVFAAAREAQAAGRWVVVIGSPDRPPDVGLVINGVAIEQAPDLILVGKDGTAIVEDKNGREWMAPPWSLEVWELIGKAVRHNALPVLVCRKVTYPLFLVFKQIGALAFQMHGQVFPAEFAERLARVKHREGLGFADIRFGDQPPPALVHFLTATVPDLLAERLEMFREYRDLLTEFAINRGLNDDGLPGPAREATYREFYRALKGWDQEPQEEFEPPDQP